ncbi:MAG: sigma-54 dependent transcriptional regulator [Gemmatimonadota bacterium]|nr:sigma-54 dependent transcriptional regulator [Gemmatimonadota bacterium]
MGGGIEDIQARAGESAELPTRDPLAIPAEVKASIRLLIVEDERSLRDGLTITLRTEGYAVTAASSGAQALEALKSSTFDIVLTDLHLTPVSGIEVVRAALRARRDTIVVVITGNPSVTGSIEALRAGAWDYLPKPFSATHLQILLGRAAHAVLQAREARDLRAELLRMNGNDTGLALIGTAPTFREAVELARKVAGTDVSVFISGESGTGKELFAQFIAQHSRRAGKALVAINCAALPEPLLESEMFGYRRGAFTGAVRDKPGLLETANGGTMFLDEVTEMPLALQAKLLRVLQDGVVRRVGSERTDAVVDVRFISATNREPQEAVNDGKLRSDILYRLRVVPIRIPPLRERRDDIALLARYFLSHAWARHRRPETVAPRLTKTSLDFLRSQPWPGNVRELQNVMEHLAVLAEAGQAIEPADIPVAQEPDDAALTAGRIGGDILRDGFHAAKERLVTEFERSYVRRVVDRAGGNMARAARLANVDRATLYRLLEKHQVDTRRQANRELNE